RLVANEAGKLSEATGERVSPQKMHEALERYYSDQGADMKSVVPHSELKEAVAKAAKDPKFKEYLSDLEAASAKYRQTGAEGGEVSAGTAHGSGGVSREELSLKKQGEMLIFNKKTGELSPTSSRAMPGRDGVILHVRPDGRVDVIGGDPTGMKIGRDVM